VGSRLLPLLVLAGPLLAGCAAGNDQDVREVRDWTLVAPSGTTRTIHVPDTFSDAELDARSRVTLETTVPLPAAWRDRPLTLAITTLVGGASLRADDREVPQVVTGLSHAWPIGPTGGEALKLTLDLDARVHPALVGAPRLSATSEGDGIFRAARSFNFLSSVVAVAINGFLCVLYGFLFFADRRRIHHGWFLLQALASLPMSAYQSGVLIALAPWSNVVPIASAWFAVVAGAGFARAYFDGKRLPRRWLAGAAVIALCCMIPGTPASRVVAAQGVALLILVAVAANVVLDVRALRRPEHRFSAATLVASWGLLVLFSIPDLWFLDGFGELTGGFKGVCVSTTIYSVCQSIVLGRDHIRSLRDAEGRVKELEARGREVGELNEELRRQVAERSRELTEALARAEGTVAPPSLAVGDVFEGRYRVVRALGQGGMGAVYEVERAHDGRRLALKVMTRELSARAAARLAREAEIGARVRHDNLVAIVDVGVAAGGTPFLLMELVQGGSMEDRRGRFGEREWALRLLQQVAEGVAALHQQGIVHRDLKPGNVLLVDGGDGSTIAKISDFGISGFGSPGGDHDDDASASGPATRESPRQDLTQTGALMGTPLYMPPEALLGAARHPSADVFALGVLAYEALTGRAPFAIPAILLARAREAIPVPAAPEGIPPDLGALLVACLRADPQRRPRAAEIAAALGGRRGA
jgi:hypothetical protein